MSVVDETRRIELPAVTTARRWPHLVIVEGDDLGQVFRLLDPETIIGRAQDADIRLTSDSVSRRHARLTLAGDQVFVEDLGSRNGTFVDMDTVKWRQPLKAGAHLAVGYSTLFRLTHAVVRDAAVRKATFEHSSRDPVTRAANTHYFLDRLRGEHAYAVRHHEPLTLVFLRVDEVAGSGSAAEVEETQEVESAMRRVGSVIRPTLRAEDLLTRAGSTFVALLRSSAGQATEMAERVRSCVATALSTSSGRPATLTAVVVPLPASAPAAPETILATASQVANVALADGNDRVVLLPKLSMETTLEDAPPRGKP